MMAPSRPSLDSHRHSGFTLIELLVSIAIMAVVAALTLPAIQQARVRMRGVQSQSNLARLGEAFHAYHLSQGSLPAGSIDGQSPARAMPDRFVWGWGLQLLPYLDETNRYRALDPARGVFAESHRAVTRSAPPVFVCPLGTPKKPLGYAACHHDRVAEITESNSGVFCLNQPVRLSDLVDGTQYSLFVGEAAGVRWSEGTFGSLRHVGITYDPHDASQLAGLTPAEVRAARREMARENESQAKRERGGENPDEMASGTFELENENGGMPGEWIDNGEHPPAPPTSEVLKRDRPPTSFAPVGGAGTRFLLGDGSVRVISSSIDLSILRRLANRFDHWTAGEF
ncbi:MAG: DUF1559 domain-containing protein [Planctomycetota bacterium]|nr:MAG: DUF1559 domain-containing protein [Planctomycetota bacterium]